MLLFFISFSTFAAKIFDCELGSGGCKGLRNQRKKILTEFHLQDWPVHSPPQKIPTAVPGRLLRCAASRTTPVSPSLRRGLAPRRCRGKNRGYEEGHSNRSRRRRARRSGRGCPGRPARDAVGSHPGAAEWGGTCATPLPREGRSNRSRRGGAR